MGARIRSESLWGLPAESIFRGTDCAAFTCKCISLAGDHDMHIDSRTPSPVEQSLPPTALSQSSHRDSRSERWGRLMASAQTGDSRAYEELLRELDRWLRRYFARRLPGPAADDATQETLLAIHRKRHTYQPA